MLGKRHPETLQQVLRRREGENEKELLLEDVEIYWLGVVALASNGGTDRHLLQLIGQENIDFQYNSSGTLQKPPLKHAL
jgi:hypothetical protein